MRPDPRSTVLSAAFALTVAMIHASFAEGPSLPTIRSLVVDEAGTPVAGASVSLPRALVDEEMRSGADGRFAIRLGPAKSDNSQWISPVEARAEGGDRIGLAMLWEPAAGRGEPLRVVLKPSRRLLVRVVDREGGPVEGATVGVQAAGLMAMGVRPGRTDAGGLARFRLAADLAVVAILAVKDRVGADSFENYSRYYPVPDSSRLDPLPAEVTLKLRRSRTVTIAAVDAEGRPVPCVVFYPVRMMLEGKLGPALPRLAGIGEATTGADGIARFAWLPESGDCSFVASKPGLRPTLLIRPGGDVEATYHVVPAEAKARLAGKVLGADGVPASGMIVVANGVGASAFSLASARTGEDGTYSMAVAPGNAYILAVVDPDRAADVIVGVRGVAGESREGLDFNLAEGTRCRGRVVDARGQPLAYRRIIFQLGGPEVPDDLKPTPGTRLFTRCLIHVQADADGRCQIALGPGSYQVIGLGNIKAEGTGEVVRDITIPAEVPASLISGLVVDGEGRPVAGAVVRTYQFGSSLLTMTTRADAAGRFQAQLGSFTRQLVHAETAGSFGLPRLNASTKDLRVVIAPAATATGRVVDEVGRPLPRGEVRVTMVEGAGGGPATGVALPSQSLEVDGGYRLVGLVPGARYEVRARGASRPRAAEWVVVKAFRVAGPGPIDLGDFVFPTER